jgi:hypothetical protein
VAVAGLVPSRPVSKILGHDVGQSAGHSDNTDRDTAADTLPPVTMSGSKPVSERSLQVLPLAFDPEVTRTVVPGSGRI